MMIKRNNRRNLKLLFYNTQRIITIYELEINLKFEISQFSNSLPTSILNYINH